MQVFRMEKKKLLRIIKSVRKSYDTLNQNGRLTPEIKLNLRRMKVTLCVRYLNNMNVEVSPRNLRIHYERQNFARFAHEFCS